MFIHAFVRLGEVKNSNSRQRPSQTPTATSVTNYNDTTRISSKETAPPSKENNNICSDVCIYILNDIYQIVYISYVIGRCRFAHLHMIYIYPYIPMKQFAVFYRYCEYEYTSNLDWSTAKTPVVKHIICISCNSIWILW